MTPYRSYQMIQKLSNNPDGHDIARAVNALIITVETKLQDQTERIMALEVDVKKLQKKPVRRKT